MTELKPCPFCGGKMALVVCREPNYFEGKLNGYQYQVVCDASSGKGCGASCGYQDDLETAIKEWNRRTENDDR